MESDEQNFLAKYFPPRKTMQMKLEIAISFNLIRNLCMKHERGSKNNLIDSHIVDMIEGVKFRYSTLK